MEKRLSRRKANLAALEDEPEVRIVLFHCETLILF